MRSPSSAMQTQGSSLPNIPGLGGAIAGLIGGAAMAVAGALLALISRDDIWLEAKQISAFVYSPAVTEQAGFVAGPVIVGTLIHFIASILFGAAFGIIFGRILRIPSTFGSPVVAGLIYGMIVWFLAYFIILPITNPELLDMYAPVFILQHIVYGMVTGLAYLRLRHVPYVDDPGYAS